MTIIGMIWIVSFVMRTEKIVKSVTIPFSPRPVFRTIPMWSKDGSFSGLKYMTSLHYHLIAR
jgi:hypothetical protein